MRAGGMFAALLTTWFYIAVSQGANSTGVGDYVAAGLGQTAASTTSSTTTSSTTTSSTTIPTTTTTASTAPSCPGVNNTQITDDQGVKYTIYCDMYLPADNDTVPRTYTTRADYSLCAPDCDQINGCTGFTWLSLDNNSGTCSFRMNHGLPIASDEDEDIEVSISGRRVGNSTGSGTLGASSTTSSSRISSTSTITACAAYGTALPNNTLGWYTRGPNLTFSGAVATWSCLPENAPCNLICGDDEPSCISSGSSVAATCSPQWSAYSCSYSSYVSEHITGSYTTTYGDIFVSTIMEYPTTVTANTSFTFQAWGGGTEIVTPVYVFGTPTAVSTVTSTADDYVVHTVASSNRVYWASTTDTESTYGTTYTTAYLDLMEYPLTDVYPVPTPACTITEVYSETCDSGNGGAGQYCNIYGGTVEVFYWPGVTPGPDGTFASTTKPVDPSTTEVSGITMTSPSVYVSFQSVYAADSCRQIGAMYTGSVLAFDPASISTVYGGPGFMSDAVPDGASVYNFGDLGPTINAAAYERQVDCVVETGCPTIYPTYAPTISVPSELRSLDPSWASCYPDFRGFYDPPKALQQQSTIAGPSGYTSATPSPTISPVAANTGTTTQPQSTTQATSTAAGSSSPDQDTSAHASPVAKSSVTAESPNGYTSPLVNPTTDDGSEPSQTTSAASATDGGTSPRPAYTQSASSPAPEDAQSSQGDGDPTNAQTPNAGGIIGSLLGGGATHDAEVPTAAADSDPAITSADPGGPESLAAATTGSGLSNADPGGAGSSAAPPALTVAGSTVTPDSSGNYIIGSSTLVAGSSPVVVGGVTYSLATSGSAVVVNGVTQPLSPAASVTSAPAVYVVDGQTYTQSGSSGLVIAGITLDAGSQTVASGTMYSLASDGSALVVNGVTESALDLSQATAAHGVFTADGQSYTEGSASEVVIAGQTLLPGSQDVISGTTYSLAPSGSALVVNGVTQTSQSVGASDAVLTVGSNIYTEDQSISGFVIGSQTLTEGGTVTVGSGTAAETLRMTTESGGVTEVVFGTTSTEVIGGDSKTSGGSLILSSTSTASGSRGSAATATSGSNTTASAATASWTLPSAWSIIASALCYWLTVQ